MYQPYRKPGQPGYQGDQVIVCLCCCMPHLDGEGPQAVKDQVQDCDHPPRDHMRRKQVQTLLVPPPHQHPHTHGLGRR